jgi:anaerobic selenocysteine-containing dehydrogenase
MEVAGTEVVKSVCGLCLGGCGVLITLKDGKPVEIQGDPESPPNKGGLCKIGRAALEYLYNPDRLKHPLKRVGDRGAGEWQQISWDEALALTAEALNKEKKDNGPESVLMVHGAAKPAFIDTHLVRLANAFGTPNVVCADHVCHIPRMLAPEFTFGFFTDAEYEYPPACIMAWGCNKVETGFYLNRALVQSQAKGAKLIAIDPLETPHAKTSELWLQVRPGTDLALALGMINVIINEALFDEAFVDTWTTGFEKLEAHVQDYSPEQVAKITWVPADLIIKAATLYATNRPGHIEMGNALDQNLNSFQTCRAISILMAITGNLDVPGGEIESHATGFRYGETVSSGNGMYGRWSCQLELRDELSMDERQSRVAPDLLPDYRYVTPQSVLKSILEGNPYKIRTAFIQASNPLSSWPNIEKTYRAFKKLDFIAVSDMFMTPTTALADVVFPVCSFLEFDGINLLPHGALAQFQRKVAQIGECRSDHEIINGLAKKLELGEYFWDSIEDFWNYILEPTGLTFKKFKNMGQFTGKKRTKQYKQYEEHGFRTPSGKVELYSTQLEELGFDPMPVYHEPSETPFSDPGLVKEYPLLCTARKVAAYRHSGGRQIPSLRHSHPDPVVIIHPDTASKLGIKEGDWAYIETTRGRIKQKAKVSTGVDPRVIISDIAWWYPERGVEEGYGWEESNYNVLTNDDLPSNPEVGSFNIRGLACKAYKVS